jgi:hypothetical protein
VEIENKLLITKEIYVTNQHPQEDPATPTAQADKEKERKKGRRWKGHRI